MLVRTLQGEKTWRHQRVKIPKRGVFIIDEAGMLDTRTLSRLLHHCKKSDATVIAASDTKQLPPILAGGPMDHLAAKSGHASLTVNRRQMDPEDRRAVASVREGDIKAALRNYAERDRLKIADTASDAIRELAVTWSKSGGYRKPKEHLILTQTRADASELNRLCQRERIKKGRVLPGLRIRHGEHKFYIGDRVAFAEPMRKHGIENGQSGTVIGVDPITRKLIVRKDQAPTEKQKAMGIGRVAKISLLRLDRDAIRLGYASTTHRAQGMTCENAYVLLTGPMISHELTYTQLTRARKSTKIFIDKTQAGNDLDDLAKAVARSVAKDLAHDRKHQRREPRRKKRQQKSIETPALQLRLDDISNGNKGA